MPIRPDRGDFLFAIPPTDETLSVQANIAIQIGALASRQVTVERTRVYHTDGRPENVAEHSLMLGKVAPELALILYPDLDENLVARFATLHDDVEAYVGDTPTDIFATVEPEDKEKLEAAALAQLATEYAHITSYVALIRQYEAQGSPESRFVRAVDKLLPLIVHFHNEAATTRSLYTYEEFLESERVIIERDRHKYGEFDAIIELRRELGNVLAGRYLNQ